MYNFILVVLLFVTSAVYGFNIPAAVGEKPPCLSTVNVPTRIAQASHVFEGRAERVLHPVESREDAPHYVVVFSVGVVYKGGMDRHVNNPHVDNSKLVSVGLFGKHLEGMDACRVDVDIGSIYTIFVANRTWYASEPSQTTPFPLYKMTGLPEFASDSLRKKIRRARENSIDTSSCGKYQCSLGPIPISFRIFNSIIYMFCLILNAQSLLL